MLAAESNALAPDGESFANYIRRVRSLRGLSRAYLAKLAEVHESTIIRIENGKTTGQKVHANVCKGFARGLQVPERYIRASAKGEVLVPGPSTKVCPSCWVPTVPPDARWLDIDALFCLLCGWKLSDCCPRCQEPLWLHSKFCPECGLNYRELAQSSPRGK